MLFKKFNTNVPNNYSIGAGTVWMELASYGWSWLHIDGDGSISMEMAPYRYGAGSISMELAPIDGAGSISIELAPYISIDGAGSISMELAPYISIDGAGSILMELAPCG